MRRQIGSLLLGASLVVGGCATQHESLESCLKVAERGLRAHRRRAQPAVPRQGPRGHRALPRRRAGGRVARDARGSTGRTTGRRATRGVAAAARATSHLGANGRGIDGALLDLEYQRIELIRFNLFDNSGTYRDYVTGATASAGRRSKVWPRDAACRRTIRASTTAVGGDRDAASARAS